MTQPTHQSSRTVDVHDPHHEQRRRPAWRQRLVLAERGLVRGVRSDSTFSCIFLES